MQTNTIDLDSILENLAEREIREAQENVAKHFERSWKPGQPLRMIAFE